MEIILILVGGVILALGVGFAHQAVVAYRCRTLTLSQAIQNVADRPTLQNQTIFVNKLIESELGLIILDSKTPINHLELITTRPGDDIRVATSTGPNGEPFLLAVCDVPTYFDQHPEHPIAIVTPKTALELAIQGGFEGLIVQKGDDAWAGVLKSEVERLLQLPKVKNQGPTMPGVFKK
ncbi:MAG TPA: hypothetical protein PKZ53_19610 [Acidobacteriota bacterium]|nr:hypothetical protein [Acidobacteriota bacterium]HNJ42704.1 hypothetical protein [Acidobacteriota bacterium]